MITHKQENECTEAALQYIWLKYGKEKPSPTTAHPENGDLSRTDEQPDSSQDQKEFAQQAGRSCEGHEDQTNGG